MKETINKIFSLFLAGQKIKAMEFALNSNLFDFLKDKSANFGDITQFLKSDEENTKIFLNALCSLGLLERKNDFYKNSAFSERYFVKSSKFYCGELFYLRKRMGESGAKCLKSLILQGNSAVCGDDMHSSESSWASYSQGALRQYQNIFYKKIITSLEKEINFKNIKSMLDIGAGAGIFDFELVKKYKNLNAVLFDLKGVTSAAKQNAREYDLKDRIKFISKDADKDDIGGGYDLIICMNLFYFTRDVTRICKKIYKALNKNGIFISMHSCFGDEKIDQDLYFNFLFLILRGHTVFSSAKLCEILKLCGFESIGVKTCPETLLQTQTIHIARK